MPPAAQQMVSVWVESVVRSAVLKERDSREAALMCRLSSTAPTTPCPVRAWYSLSIASVFLPVIGVTSAD